MNWDKANAITKGIVYIAIRLVLLLGAVFGAMTLGGLTFALQQQAGSGAPQLFGLAAGITFYLAGLAGREQVTSFLQRHLLPPKAETPSPEGKDDVGSKE